MGAGNIIGEDCETNTKRDTLNETQISNMIIGQVTKKRKQSDVRTEQGSNIIRIWLNRMMSTVNQTQNAIH